MILCKKLKLRLFNLPRQKIVEPLYREKGRDPRLQERLETIASFFVGGFNTALKSDTNEELGHNLNRVEPGYRSFAYEGAGMYLGVSGVLFPGREKRFFDFIQTEGRSHNIILTTGAGLALAKMRFFKRRTRAFLGRFDPYLILLPYDSFGFYDAINESKQVIENCREPEIPEIAKPLYDQGIGRSIWILKSTGMENIANSIAGFPAFRRGDLWCGLWFALSFTGGVKDEEVNKLWESGKNYRPYGALGIVQAAYMRETHGFMPAWTEHVCRMLLNKEGNEAAKIFEESARQVREKQNSKSEPLHGGQDRLMIDIRRHILNTIIRSSFTET